MNAITNAITQMQNALTVAIVNTATMMQQTPDAVAPFICSPLQVNQADILNLSTKENRKHYEHVMKSLFADNEKCAEEPEKLQTFINLWFKKLMDLGMFGTGMSCMIPTQSSQPRRCDTINMASNYG